jgi:antiviral helicase SKI2
MRELINERAVMIPIILNAKCVECPKFLQHFEMEHAEWLVKTQIQDIMHQMSDQNLALLPDYNQRVEVLKDLGFIDVESRVLLKGKVACEIHSADELILTELILDNILADFEPSEIVALLSSFVFQEKSEVDPYNHVNSSLQRGIDAIIGISKRVNNVQTLHQVILASDEADFESQPRFQLVEVVYNWAEGMGFKEIMNLTDVMEGTIVRVVTRLDETCREVMSAARLIGDPGLYAKMEKAREMIRRDVVFTASLYM